MQPPDFAIVGAPKCGTTALYTYLSDHPGVAVAARKEPHFWSSDIPRAGQVVDRGDYDALWRNAPNGALRGEASPEYLRSQVAIPNLLAARPDARLIAMVRNPVDLVASLHSNLLVGWQEDERDLETAWRLQARRHRGEGLPPGCREPVLLQYGAYAAIGDHLERFFALVPAEQRLVIIYDAFKADTGGEYRRVLDFLGLPDDGRRELLPVHVNRAVRSPRLVRFQRSLPAWLGPLYVPARAAVRALGLRPTDWLHRLNVRAAPRKPLGRAFEAELIETFRPQVEKIERLLGRTLPAWKVPRGS